MQGRGRRGVGGWFVGLAVCAIVLAQFVLFFGFRLIQWSGEAEEQMDIPLVRVVERIVSRAPGAVVEEESEVVVAEVREVRPEPASLPPRMRPPDPVDTREAESELLARVEAMRAETQARDEEEAERPIAMRAFPPVPRLAVPEPPPREPSPDEPPPDEPAMLAPVVEAPPPREIRAPPVVRIVDVEQKRFPAEQDTDEVRVLNIAMALTDGAENVRGGDVMLLVSFFDQLGDSGVAVPTRAQSSTVPIHLQDREWRHDAHYLVSATYSVPAGFRERQERETGFRPHYFGYRVELYHQGVRQHVFARPRVLYEEL